MTYDHDWSDLSLANLRQRFAYQCLDNVKCTSMQSLIKNILCRSREVSICTKRPRLAKMMLGQDSSSFCLPVTGQCEDKKE